MKFKRVKLGEYLYIKGRIGWKGLKKAEYLSNGNYRIINAESLETDKINWNKVDYISEARYFESPEIMLQNGDILISKDGTIGKIGYIENLSMPTTVASGIFVIRNLSTDIIKTRFIYYFLRSRSFRNFIRIRTEGSVIPHLYQRDFIDLDFPLPPIKVQENIVAILDAISNKIKLNNCINDNLQRQAQALYTAAFVENHSLKTFPGVLSDIATITMGQSPSGSSYNKTGIGEVFYQGRAEFDFRFPAKRLFTTEPKRIAEAGDVLLSVRAPVGDLNVAYERCCIGRGLGAIHSKNGNNSFLLYTMFALKKQLDIFNGEGTVFGSINRDALNSMPIDIPPSSEITRFETIVRPMDALIRTNYEEICRLQFLRDGLLPRLISGELDVSELNI